MISLRYEANRRPPEISRALKWSLESVNVALSKARAFLRDCVRRSATGEPS
jgi:hypothetical protein